jgi:serine/threonine protein phosphatase PrpC
MTEDRLYALLERWLLRKTQANSIRRVGDLPVAIATDIGLVREENQDRVAVARFRGRDGAAMVVVILCDGMGGMTAGAVCATMTLARFVASMVYGSQGIDLNERVLHATRTANMVVHERFHASGGATLSALVLTSGGQLVGVNVGDSRIYEFKRQPLTLSQITVDDTLAAQLGHRGEAHIGRNELLQYVGIGSEIEPHLLVPSAKFDESALLLTSDGVHFLPHDAIGRVMGHAGDPALGIRRLVELSKWCGGHDNASAALVASFPSPAPADHGTDRVLEVWDPFGELQILLEDPPRVPAEQKPAAYEERPKDGANPAPLKPKTERPKRYRPPKRQKATTGKEDSGSDKAEGEGDQEAPQLRIDFPGKTPNQ